MFISLFFFSSLALNAPFTRLFPIPDRTRVLCRYHGLITCDGDLAFLALNNQIGSRTCPKGLNPAQAIAKLKLELAAE